jgi:ABC-2 type transport system permease protein
VRKTLVIANREYAAAVKSKAFVVSLVLMPLLMFGGIFVQRMAAKIGDVKTKRLAVIDRSPGGQLYAALEEAARVRNEKEIFDKQTGKQTQPKIDLERVEPTDLSNKDAVDRQRLELSDRVRREELFAFIEIGPDILDPKIQPTTATTRAADEARRAGSNPFGSGAARGMDAIPETARVRFASNRPTNVDVRNFVQNALVLPVYSRRLAIKNLPAAEVMPLLIPPVVQREGLTKRTATGQIQHAERTSEVIAFLVPFVLTMLMFMVVLVGGSPLTTNLVEEKQLRIAEVLLGSVRPFELMMGKLIGGVGVALTLAVVYFIGVFFVARQFGAHDAVAAPVITWFLIFTVLGTFMYGAMFLAAGSAVTNVKEAQSMLTPVIILIVLPTFILQSLLTDPSGTPAMIGSFFPTSAPMVTVARIAIPPGVPLWQVIVSALVTLATTVAIIWCSGRIFRVGILMQGQGAKMGEMLKWVVRG